MGQATVVKTASTPRSGITGRDRRTPNGAREETASESNTGRACSPDVGAAVKPYVSGRELAQLTPWTNDAIEAMVRRGILQEGREWFRPLGRRERVFKWQAIVDRIEGDRHGPPRDGAAGAGASATGRADRIPMANGGELIVTAQTDKA